MIANTNVLLTIRMKFLTISIVATKTTAKIQPAHSIITNCDFILRGSCFCEYYICDVKCFSNDIDEVAMQEAADLDEYLVPIRLDVDLEGHRLRDTITWNKNGRFCIALQCNINTRLITC